MTVKAKAKPKAKRQRIVDPFGIPAEHRDTLMLIPGYDPCRDAEGYHYDPARALVWSDCFEKVLTHVKGRLRGTPFILEPWERAIVWNLSGWRRQNGNRRYRRFLIYVPKKNGKTPLAAGIVVTCLATDNEPGAEIVGAANAKEQAGYIFEQALGMVEASPLLRSRLKIYGRNGGSVVRSIVYEAQGSSYKVVSADAGTFDGGNVHVGIIDELHRFDSDGFPDLLESSDAARDNSLIGSITTADYNRPDSPCNKRYRYACKVRDGVVKDAKYLPVIYEARKDDDWTVEATWKKANPNYGVSIDPEWFAAQCEKAKNEPSFTNMFKRLHLNIITDTFKVWIPDESWEACGPRDAINAEQARAPLYDAVGPLDAYLGMDLSSKLDLACCTVIVPEQVGHDEATQSPAERATKNRRYTSFTYSYMPRDNAEEKAKEDKAPYMLWAEQGWLRLTPGNVIDYQWIRKDIRDEIAKKLHIAEIGYDPWNATQFALELQDQDSFHVVEVRQGVGSMSEPAKVWEAMVLGGKWRHDGSPVMRWCVSNAVCYTDPAGNIRPDKAHSTGRIDGVSSLITGLARAMLGAGAPQNVGEVRWI